MKENNTKIKSSKSKNKEIKISIKCPTIDPKDLYMLSYIVLSRLDAKIIRMVENLKKDNLAIGELYFQIPKREKIPMSLLLYGESNQLTITCKHKEINEAENLIRNVGNDVLRLAENFSKLNEENKKRFREVFKILKEVDRTIQSILNRRGVEELYFSLSLLRERTCSSTKNLLDISIKTGHWLNILNSLRKGRNDKLSKETAKKLLLDLFYWKERILQDFKNIEGE